MTDETRTEDEKAALFRAMESMKDAAAVFSGARKEFLDNGWTPENAEQMILALLRHALTMDEIKAKNPAPLPFPFGPRR